MCYFTYRAQKNCNYPDFNVKNEFSLVGLTACQYENG